MYIPFVNTIIVLDVHLLTGTKREILEMLLDGPMTALEMSKKLKIQINAVREHLASLESSDLVAYTFVNTGKGRPKKVYQITKKGADLFPKRYDLLLKIFLDQLESEMGKEWVKSFLERAGSNVVSGINPKAGIEGLLNFYNSLGCMATVSTENGSIVIKRRNCIYYNLAVDHENLVCESFEDSILNKLFPSYRVVKKDTVKPGKFDCEIIIEEKSSKSA